MAVHESPTGKRTEQLAGELHERARTLNHLTQDPPGLTRPEAAHTILGNLAQTAFRLIQTAERLAAFLNRELDTGRLGPGRGDDPLPTVEKAHDALVKAAEQSMDLAESFRRAQGALADIHGAEDDGEPSRTKAEEVAETTAKPPIRPPEEWRPRQRTSRQRSRAFFLDKLRGIPHSHQGRRHRDPASSPSPPRVRGILRRFMRTASATVADRPQGRQFSSAIV